MGSTPIRSTEIMIIKLKVFFIIIFLFFALLFVAFSIFVLHIVDDKNFEPKKICFEENCFSVELADTPQKRTQGLMFRQELQKDNGMLFVFPKQGIYSFWMKNTLIPLDIIWISQGQKVVFIKKDALPCKADIYETINPKKEAKYVLELKTGVVEAIGLKVTDKCYFEF